MTAVCNLGMVRWGEEPEVEDQMFRILQLFHPFSPLAFNFCLLVKLFVILACGCGTKSFSEMGKPS